MKILFIGNSNTYYNDLPKTVEALGRANGLDWEADSLTKGGWSFRQYAAPDDVMHEPLKQKLAGEWDVIFLQDRTEYPLTDPESSKNGAAVMCSLMQNRPERLLVYATFARNDGHPHLETLGMTRTEMAQRVHSAMSDVAAHIGAELSDASTLFQYMKENRPDIEMYAADRGHPSPAGSYLASILHYLSLTGKLPEKVAAVPSLPDEEEAKHLLEAAREYFALYNTRGEKR